MRLKIINYILFGIFLILNLVDLVSTLVALDLGYQEKNLTYARKSIIIRKIVNFLSLIIFYSLSNPSSLTLFCRS